MSQSQRPNVLLIIADQHRWDFMGHDHSNGTTFTPNLDRLGRSGAILRAAHCPAPLCCPSRAAFHSGRYAANTGCFTNLHQLPPGTPSFVSQFQHAGYRTAAVGKTHLEIHAYDADFTSPAHLDFMRTLGWDDVHEADGMTKEGIWCQYGEFLQREGALQPFLDFTRHWRYFMDTTSTGDPSFACHPWTLPEHQHLTSWVGNRATEWIEDHTRERPETPFLLHVGFLAPHSPTMPPPEYLQLYQDTEETAPWANPDPKPWLAGARRGYRAMITHLDRYVGQLLDCLKARGLLDNTIVVYTADHGEMAGDHGRTDKTTFHEASIRVPLLIAGPGIPSRLDSSALVETLDIGRTLSDLCAVPPHDLDQGHSLVPLLSGATTTHRDTVYAEMGCDRMLRTDRYKLAWGEPSLDTRQLGRLHLDKPVNIPPSPPALYDLHVDPHETQNLIGDPNHRDLHERLLTQLLTRINQNTQTRPYLSRGEYRPLRDRLAAQSA